MQPHQDDHPHVPGQSLWPVGFAIGVVVFLVGLIISWWVAGLGALVALAFAFLWVRDLSSGTHLAVAAAVEPERPTNGAGGRAEPEEPHEPITTEERFPRSRFLEFSTLGLGGVIGGLVSAPAIGFMVAPAFLKQGDKDHNLGPISDYAQDKFVVVTWFTDPKAGEVSRRTAFVRYNGIVPGKQGGPSFTILTNHCAHLGCPVQPNGLLDDNATKHVGDVTLIPTIAIAGFGCPCHGGQYNTEGNRTAGPPVRALDRYAYSIRNGNLYVGKPFSVSHVDGTGATATIHKWAFSFPGEHVNGIESWLYPIQPPH